MDTCKFCSERTARNQYSGNQPLVLCPATKGQVLRRVTSASSSTELLMTISQYINFPVVEQKRYGAD